MLYLVLLLIALVGCSQAEPIIHCVNVADGSVMYHGPYAGTTGAGTWVIYLKDRIQMFVNDACKEV